MPSTKLSLLLAASLCCGLSSGFVASNAGRLTHQAGVRRSRSMQMMAEEGYQNAQRSIFDTEGVLDTLFEKNRLWAESQDPANFARIANSQSPKYLYIGCSDSRVPAEKMLGMDLGELFVHRNVANLVINTDYSLMSVLKFSIEALGITDIIVCGHTGCGGVKAAMANKDHGLLEHWLHNIRNVQRYHEKELAAIPDENDRHNRLIELNVQEQCMNLFANPIVQKMQATESKPRIHGLVYDIASGLIKDVKIDFAAEFSKHRDIYRLYESPDLSANTVNMTPRTVRQEVPEPVAAAVPEPVAAVAEPVAAAAEAAAATPEPQQPEKKRRSWSERAKAAKHAYFTFR